MMSTRMGDFNVIILITLVMSVVAQEASGARKKHLRRRHRSLDYMKQYKRRQQQRDLNEMIPAEKSTTTNEWQGTYYTPSLFNQGDVDLFLLSGQSNMQGHTTSEQSIGGNGNYWMQIKSILEAGGDHVGMENALFDAILAANSNNEWLSQSDADVVATTLADETMRLYTAGLLYNLDTPLSLGT